MPPDGLILGFDTAAAHCAAALVQGGRILAARSEAMDRGQAERLFPLLEAVLRDAGAGWADLGGIGVGTGPGNFTGVRIAVAAARGIALARGLPAAGVSRLEALAAGRPGRWLVAVPGRTGTVYAQAVADGVAAGPVVEAAPGALPAGFADGCLGAIGAAAAGLGLASGPRIAGPLTLDPLHEPDPAPAIARIAAARIASGAVSRAAGPRPAPVYARPPDAAPPSDPGPRILP